MGKTPSATLPSGLSFGNCDCGGGDSNLYNPSVPPGLAGWLLFIFLVPGAALWSRPYSPCEDQAVEGPGGSKPLILWRLRSTLLPSPQGRSSFGGGEPGWRLLPALLFQGAAVLGLGRTLAAVYRVYPASRPESEGRAPVPFGQGMLLLTGVFMVLLGLLLIPVNLGLLPFAQSAQLGLLMVIFAVQTAAAGNTPVGPFPRSAATTFAGLAFGARGGVKYPAFLDSFLSPGRRAEYCRGSNNPAKSTYPRCKKAVAGASLLLKNCTGRRFSGYCL